MANPKANLEDGDVDFVPVGAREPHTVPHRAEVEYALAVQHYGPLLVGSASGFAAPSKRKSRSKAQKLTCTS